MIQAEHQLASIWIRNTRRIQHGQGCSFWSVLKASVRIFLENKTIIQNKNTFQHMLSMSSSFCHIPKHHPGNSSWLERDIMAGKERGSLRSLGLFFKHVRSCSACGLEAFATRSEACTKFFTDASRRPRRLPSCSNTRHSTRHSVPLPATRKLQLPSRSSMRKDTLSVFPVKKPNKVRYGSKGHRY